MPEGGALFAVHDGFTSLLTILMGVALQVDALPDGDGSCAVAHSFARCHICCAAKGFVLQVRGFGALILLM